MGGDEECYARRKTLIHTMWGMAGMNKTFTDPRRVASLGVKPLAQKKLPINAPKEPDRDVPLRR